MAELHAYRMHTSDGLVPGLRNVLARAQDYPLGRVYVYEIETILTSEEVAAIVKVWFPECPFWR